MGNGSGREQQFEELFKDERKMVLLSHFVIWMLRRRKQAVERSGFSFKTFKLLNVFKYLNYMKIMRISYLCWFKESLQQGVAR